MSFTASRVLVTGDRRWATEVDASGQVSQVKNEEHWFLCAILDGLCNSWLTGFGSVHLTPFTIIEGKAMGADSVANWWATESPMHPPSGDDMGFGSSAFEHMCFPADWEKYGKHAGPIRNQQMLDEGQPDFVVAVHRNWDESRGTADMVKRCIKSDLPVYKVTSPLSSDGHHQLKLL